MYLYKVHNIIDIFFCEGTDRWPTITTKYIHNNDIISKCTTEWTYQEWINKLPKYEFTIRESRESHE